LSYNKSSRKTTCTKWWRSCPINSWVWARKSHRKSRNWKGYRPCFHSWNFASGSNSANSVLCQFRQFRERVLRVEIVYFVVILMPQCHRDVGFIRSQSKFCYCHFSLLVCYVMPNPQIRSMKQGLTLTEPSVRHG
jgi:hypothetical protein